MAFFSAKWMAIISNILIWSWDWSSDQRPGKDSLIGSRWAPIQHDWHSWKGIYWDPEDEWMLPKRSDWCPFSISSEIGSCCLSAYNDPLEECVVSRQIKDTSEVGVSLVCLKFAAALSLRKEKRKFVLKLAYLAANKRLYMAFVDLEKAFDSSASESHLVGAENTWCGGVDCATGAGDVCQCVGEEYSEEFEVKVGVHQGLVLSPLLFIIVLEALSRENRSGVPWEDLYADDLVIIAELLEECVRRLLTWKEAMEDKGLRVNAGKTKIMICGMGLDLLQSSGEFPCAVCHTGACSNSIFCNGHKHWVYKKCTGLKRLTKDPDYRSTRRQGIAYPWTADHRGKSKSDLTSWRW